MAYEGGYGGPHPYGGHPAQRPPPPRDPYHPGPPQQYDAPPQHYDGFQDNYGYENHDDGGYGQDYGAQYPDQGYGRGPPPNQGYPPRDQYGPPPPRGRGGRQPPMGRVNPADRPPPPPDPARGAPYPPRGGPSRPGGRVPPGPSPRPGPGPGPGPGRGGQPIQYERSDGSDPKGQWMDAGPRSPTSPRGYGGQFPSYPGQQRRPDFEEKQMVSQMAGMDISQRPRMPPPSGSSESQRSHMRSPENDYGRPPLDMRGPPQGFQEPRRGPPPPRAFGSEYRDDADRPPPNEFGPPSRSMTMPLNNDSMAEPRHLQRTETMPLNGPTGRDMPQRPSTSQGNRPPPQRMYTPGPDGMGGFDEEPGYGNGEQDSYARESVGDVLDYYAPSRMSNPEYSRNPSSIHSDGPNFDGASMPRNSLEQHLHPSIPEELQPQPGLERMRSQPNMRQPQHADAPPMPPLDNSRHGSMEGSHNGANGWDRPAPGGGPGPMSRPGLPSGPSPSRNSNPDALPSHPTPVRPGHMAGSMVSMNDRPAPVRHYNNGAAAPGPAGRPPPQQQLPPPQQPPPQQPSPNQPSIAKPTIPVTPEELEQLRVVIKNDPNDQNSALRLARRLIEAADVLVSHLPDPRARHRARERYLADANKILKKLSQAQNLDAMFLYADSLGRGLFSHEPENKEAFTLYQSAAKVGHASAAYRTAVCCEIGHEDGGGTRKDPLKAIQWYKRAATLGDTPAMYKMGMILLKGLLGQPRNPREAVSWLKRAAERSDGDNPHSLHELGLLYESAQPNDAIIRDEPYAFSLFCQAAELGYKFSQFRLGCAFEHGLMGCPIDPRQSIMWYSKAASQEEHQAELALSGWYLTGSEGVLQQSDTEAYLWARKAAMAGLAKAEYAMGYFTEVGIGAPANMEDAKRWYWRAASQNFPKARDRLEDLKRTGKNNPRQRERISRTKAGKQQEVFR